MGYFAKEGYPWFFFGIFITLATVTNNVNPDHPFIIYFCIWTLPMILITAFLIFFFRDPKRVPPPEYDENTSILCPADGTLRDIEEENGNLSFFIEMHGTNVHVCRAHLNGYVKKVTRLGGKHYPVYYLRKSKGQSSKAIRKNARVIIDMETPYGEPFQYFLICGKLARRAKPYVKEGQYVEKGQRIGIIMFGSLVKVTVPGTHYDIKLNIRDSVRACKMIMCERLDKPPIDYKKDVPIAQRIPTPIGLSEKASVKKEVAVNNVKSIGQESFSVKEKD